MASIFPILFSSCVIQVLAITHLISGAPANHNSGQPHSSENGATVVTTITTPTIIVYMATDGNDANNGSSPQSALATPTGARNRVRALRDALTHGTAVPAEVRVLAGRYELEDTLNLTAIDSNVRWTGLSGNDDIDGDVSIDADADNTTSRNGTIAGTTASISTNTRSHASGPSGTVKRTATSPEHSSSRTRVSNLPVFSGGSVLKWNEVASATASSQVQILTATLSDAQHAAAMAAHGTTFPQLMVDGVRATVARAPLDLDEYYTWSAAPGNSTGSVWSFGFNTSEVNPSVWAGPNGSRLDDVTALVYDAPWSCTPRRIGSVDMAKGAVTVLPPAYHAPLTDASYLGVKRWAAHNVQTGELKPGGYRYQTSTKTLTYRGSATSQAVAPRLDTIVRVTDGATNIVFDGLCFSDSAGGQNPSPASYGPPLQAALEIGPAASAIIVSSCAVVGVGANGVQVMHNVSGVVVTGSVFADVGGRGKS